MAHFWVAAAEIADSLARGRLRAAANLLWRRELLADAGGDLALAKIPKVDADGCVVHIHALRHSFGTHLSLVVVSPRGAQAAMRHSDIALTTNTYTDARLLDTAAAVESLKILPSKPKGQEPEAATVALEADYSGQFESVTDSLGKADLVRESTKKPRQTRGLPRFSVVGVTRLH